MKPQASSLLYISENSITKVNLTESAARPLFNLKDPIIKEKAIESVKKCLESKIKVGQIRQMSEIVHNKVTKIGQESKFCNPPDDLQLYNVWNLFVLLHTLYPVYILYATY